MNDATIEKLMEARTLIREALQELQVPMLEASLAEADMNLHWALWNLGVPLELVPEREKS